MTANDHAPPRDMAATSDDFPDIAQAAGLRLKEILPRNLESAIEHSFFFSFPTELELYGNIVKDVKKAFADRVGGEKPSAESL
jgi:hypothetical protein